MASPRQTRASKLNTQTPTTVSRQAKQTPIIKKAIEKLTPPDIPIVKEINSDGTIVWNEETEPILFRNVLKLKPVGPMKHWRMLLVRKRVSQALDYPVSSHAIWNHLSTLFDMKALDDMETADKVEKVEAFSLPRSFHYLKQLKLNDGTPGKETRFRKTSNSFTAKGGSDLDEDSLTGKIDDEVSNPDSPSAFLSEDNTLRKSSGKSSKRGKSSETKKPKIISDRPGTPVEASNKRSRTPLGTKRPRRSSEDMEDDDDVDTSEGRDTPASPALFLEEEVNSTSSSSKGEDAKKSTEVKSVQGMKKIEAKSPSVKKVEGKSSGKKHSDSKSSSDKRSSESKTHSSGKKSHDSKTHSSSGKKSSDKLHGSSKKSSEHKSSKHSDSHRGSSSGKKHSSSKTHVSGKKDDDEQQSASRSSDTESTSSKRSSVTKPAGTPKRPRTPSGSSKKHSSGSSSKKHSSDTSGKKTTDPKGLKKLSDDVKTTDDTQYSSSSELGRDSPSSVRELTDTPTSIASTGESTKTPAKARKRTTLSESETSDSKSVSKDSKAPGKRISLPGKKLRRV